MTDPFEEVRKHIGWQLSREDVVEDDRLLEDLLTEAVALFPLAHLGEVLVASLSGLRDSVHPNIQRAIRDFDDALVAIPERLK